MEKNYAVRKNVIQFFRTGYVSPRVILYKVYKNCQLRKVIVFLHYNISQPNFAILLILRCSFKDFPYFKVFEILVCYIRSKVHSLVCINHSLKSRIQIFYFFLDYHLYYDYVKRLNRLGPLLQDEKRFSDSSFSASASVNGHSASDARITSGSSWCAPVSEFNEKHYLQIGLKWLYRVYSLITYGDSTSPKWVAMYSLNYTDDSVNWITISVRESA